MHFTAVFQILQRLLLVILCFSPLWLVASSFSDGARNYSSELCISGHKYLHRQLNENSSTKAVVEIAQTRAFLSPAVLLGTLKSLLVQRDGTVRAWFAVNSALKLNTTRVRSSRKEDTEVVYFKSGTGRCVLELNQDKLMLGKQYLVFGIPSEKTAWPSMIATALPIPNDKRTLRAVKKLLCKGCAKPPNLSGLQRLRVSEGSRIRLNCHLAGYPIPWVEWYKDGVKLANRGRIRVRTKRRTSRLVVRRARPLDRGVYECRAGNVVRRPVSLRATLVVTRRRTTRRPHPKPTIPSTQSSPWTTEPCPVTDFCLNGGTCIYYKIVREYVCQCAEGYIGLRCDYKDVSVTLGGFKSADPSDGRLFIDILVLFLIFFCLNWACFGACWLCCFRCERDNWGKFRNMAYLQSFFKGRKLSSSKRVTVDGSADDEDIRNDKRNETFNESSTLTKAPKENVDNSGSEQESIEKMDNTA